jgi:uncharacterized protein (TIGR02145 family)
MNSKLNERFVRHTAVPRAQVYPFVILALAFLFAACSNYQEEFDNNFGALEYVDDVDYSSPSGGDDPLPLSSDVDNPSSSSFVPTSSGDIQSSSSSEDDNPSSSSVPISSGDIQSSSSVIATSSSQAVQSSSSIASSSSSAESSSSYVPPSGISYGIMTDPRTPAFSYRTVEIGNRTWMAENMAKGGGTLCPGGIHDNCAGYGHLYRWEDTKNLCPDGWSLPSKEEWEELIESVGGAKKAGKALKTISGWEENGNGTDSYGFSALPAGYWSNYWGEGGERYFGLEGAAHFWSATATESGSNSAYGLKLEFNVDSAWMSKYNVTGDYYYALSVRCILDENYFVDNRDGKTYRMVKIGDQTWMAQNLNYAGGNNSWCYEDDSKNCDKYGRLYDWNTAKSVCPEGWHLPTIGAIDSLINHAGEYHPDNDVEKGLKSAEGWNSPEENGDDYWHFSVIPGGGWDSKFEYQGEGTAAYFWSNTEEESQVWIWSIGYAAELKWKDNKDSRLSVRCQKNKD